MWLVLIAGLPPVGARPEDDPQGSKHVVVILTYIIIVIVVLTEISMLFIINLMILTQRDEFY